MKTMEREETAVQGATLILEHPHSDIDTCILQFLDSPTLYLGKLVDAANDNPLYTFLNNKVGAGGRLPIV